MKRYLCIFIFLIFASLQGCAAPGSAIGRISIAGEIKPPPKDELKLRVTLDKHYGLGGLDEYFGKPEDYGHHDKIDILNVHDDGVFKGPEAEVIYHMTFWFLPPIGSFPKTPPKPYFFIEFSNIKDEIYLVGEASESIDYKVFNIPTRKEISKQDAYWQIVSGKYLPIESEGPKGWRLKLEIEKYNNRFKKDTQNARAF